MNGTCRNFAFRSHDATVQVAAAAELAVAEVNHGGTIRYELQ